MNEDDELIAPPDLVYVTYIRAAPQRIWDALTRSELTKQFFFGRTVESDWRKGSPWRIQLLTRYGATSTAVNAEAIATRPSCRARIPPGPKIRKRSAGAMNEAAVRRVSKAPDAARARTTAREPDGWARNHRLAAANARKKNVNASSRQP